MLPRHQITSEDDSEITLMLWVPLYLATDGSGALFFARDSAFPQGEPEEVVQPLLTTPPAVLARAPEPDELVTWRPTERVFRRQVMAAPVRLSRLLWRSGEIPWEMVCLMAEEQALALLLRDERFTCERCGGDQFRPDRRRLRCDGCHWTPRN